MVVVVVSVSGAEVSVADVELSSAGCEVVVFVSAETALLSVSTNTPPLLSSSAATAVFGFVVVVVLLFVPPKPKILHENLKNVMAIVKALNHNQT